MPIYEYRCEHGHTFEVMQRMTDDPLTVCDEHGTPVQRVFHPVAVHFKGSGFYNTDYGKKKSGAAGSSSEGSSESSSSKSDSSKDSSTGLVEAGLIGVELEGLELHEELVVVALLRPFPPLATSPAQYPAAD